MARPSKRDYLLKIISDSRGLSRETIADRTGISVPNVWRAEVGRIISPNVAIKMAELLDISPDIMFYNMGRIPPDKIEFFVKDPLFFKALIDEACAEPWRLTKTIEYMGALKEKMSAINPGINKLLSQLKPTE